MGPSKKRRLIALDERGGAAGSAANSCEFDPPMGVSDGNRGLVKVRSSSAADSYGRDEVILTYASKPPDKHTIVALGDRGVFASPGGPQRHWNGILGCRVSRGDRLSRIIVLTERPHSGDRSGGSISLNRLGEED